jgi:acetaldehyde dehydrogenase (acetylating)
MANINKIVKFDLDERAVHLRGEKQLSFNEIATTLSDESGEKISKASVQRFFEARDRDRQKAVAMSSKLQAKVTEAEINTLTDIIECHDDLKFICKEAMKSGDYKTAIQAIDKRLSSIDLMNKALGKYQTTPQNVFANSDVQINLQMIDCSKRGD